MPPEAEMRMEVLIRRADGTVERHIAQGKWKFLTSAEVFEKKQGDEIMRVRSWILKGI
jgi:hypothetical protein